MYYSNGNYEAFARAKKPVGVDKKSAYLVGSGLASLAAACFLVRDGQMKRAYQVALVMVSKMLRKVLLLVVVEKWRITSNVYGTCSALFHPLKQKVYLF